MRVCVSGSVSLWVAVSGSVARWLSAFSLLCPIVFAFLPKNPEMLTKKRQTNSIGFSWVFPLSLGREEMIKSDSTRSLRFLWECEVG